MLRKKSLRLSVDASEHEQDGIGDDADIPDALTERGHAGHGHEHAKEKDERAGMEPASKNEPQRDDLQNDHAESDGDRSPIVEAQGNEADKQIDYPRHQDEPQQHARRPPLVFVAEGSK